MSVNLCGLGSMCLLVLGYVFFIHGFSKPGSKANTPNPATWFMFAYGTLLLTWMEKDRGADLAILYQPFVECIVIVATTFLVLRKSKWKFFEDAFEFTAFLIDLILTFFYIGTWIIYRNGHMDEASRQGIVSLMLVITNIGTLVSFIPTFRSVRKKPGSESAAAWLTWSAAYALLSVTTFFNILGYNEIDFSNLIVDPRLLFEHQELLIYPVSNCLWHFLVGFWALRRRPFIETRDHELVHGHR